MKLFALLTLACSMFAQEVVISQKPETQGYSLNPVYSGSDLTYLCKARSAQPISTITVSAASNANPVSFTATAHGLDYQSGATITPLISIQGATGNWTPINGVFVATPTSANTFTIAVDSTAFGALTGTLTVTTRAPKTTSLIWSIWHGVYSSGMLLWSGWASGPSVAGATTDKLGGGSPAMAFACASRTTYGYQ